jgi:dimethylamine/trimethylamine dehydrogenase
LQGDGVGRTLWKPIAGSDSENIFTPDDLMDATLESRSLLLNIGEQNRQQVVGLQNVVIYDDDHYYMGGVLAELLATQGCKVSLVTPAPLVSYWSQYTLEQQRIQAKLMKLGVKLYPQNVLSKIKKDSVRLSNDISGDQLELPYDGVVLVTDRIPNDSLYQSLKPKLDRGKLNSLRIIGDAEAPNIIAQAVFAGHLAAREFDEEKVEGTPFKVERIKI